MCLSCWIINLQTTFKCVFGHLLICLTDLPYQRTSWFPLPIRKPYNNWRGGLPGPHYRLPTSMVTSFVSCNQDDTGSNFMSQTLKIWILWRINSIPARLGQMVLVKEVFSSPLRYIFTHPFHELMELRLRYHGYGPLPAKQRFFRVSIWPTR